MPKIPSSKFRILVVLKALISVRRNRRKLDPKVLHQENDAGKKIVDAVFIIVKKNTEFCQRDHFMITQLKIYNIPSSACRQGSLFKDVVIGIRVEGCLVPPVKPQQPSQAHLCSGRSHQFRFFPPFIRVTA
jgi:hypothetical protein